MNHLLLLRTAALAGLVFASPANVLAKDRDHHGHDDHHDHHDSDRGRAFYGQPYCAPSYGYSSYGYSPYYSSRPSVSLGFYSTPSYYSTPDYDYDSYPVRTTYRTTYRGIPRASYGYSYRDSSRSSSSDALAVDVQRALARKGYYRGGIDGDIGPGTRAAIRSYQYQRGLEVTGRIDGTLLRSLGIS